MTWASGLGPRACGPEPELRWRAIARQPEDRGPAPGALAVARTRGPGSEGWRRSRRRRLRRERAELRARCLKRRVRHPAEARGPRPEARGPAIERSDQLSRALGLVEGSARHTTTDYLHYVTIAVGSASEVRYLLELAVRLGYMPPRDGEQLTGRYGRVIRALQALLSALRPEARGPRPSR